MKTLSAPLLAHIQGDVTKLANCWTITLRDGRVIRMTDHDTDIEVQQGSPDRGLNGTYTGHQGITGSSMKSSLDLSVDNLEVAGRITLDGLWVNDVEAGLWDGARIVIFQVNWEDPTSVNVLRSGRIGNIERNHEGAYKAELRGLSQLLQQPIGRTYGLNCDADFGDSRCTMDVEDWKATGVVVAVVDENFSFKTSGTLQAGSPDLLLSPYPGSPKPLDIVAGTFANGLVTFRTGNNAGMSREIKTDSTTTSPTEQVIETFEPFPYSIQVGDEFILIAGCDKKYLTCKNKFNNLVNFRGFPHVPGSDVLYRGADTKATKLK